MSSRSTAQHTVRYFWRHAWRYRAHIIGLLVALPVTVLVNQIIPPIILADVLNRLSRHDFVPHQVWQSFGPELVWYAVLVFVGSSVLWRITDFLVWHLESKVSKNMAEEVFAHLTAQSIRFHANKFGGSLVSQTNKLTSGYVRVQDTTLFNVLPLLFGVVFSVAILARLAPWFALVLFAFSVIYVVSTIFVTRKVRNLSLLHGKTESKQTGLLADAITNIVTVKSFAGGAAEQKRFRRATRATQTSLRKFGRAHQKQQLFFGGLLSSISALALAMAVVGVMVFDANIATVFLIFSYTSTVANQLFMFSNNALRNYNRAIGDAGDMIEILRTVPEVLDPTEPETPRIVRGDIVFDQVSFRHDDADEAIFHNLNLHIKPGQKVGLVGHSGSGKTTLTRVLQRFSDINGGEVRIDGQNIAAITQDDLRRHIAYVPQEPLLFHRTIAENIGYANPAASPEEIAGVAKMAHADEFIAHLPDGYDTMVGERGVKLSGGQRQRIAIARAMLKNAPVLVLDEATSALDSESEVLIQAALWKLMEGRTAIVIAHRLSTIQKMDRILVLDNGQVIEAGSHQELLARNGTYAKLWAHQSGGFIEE